MSKLQKPKDMAKQYNKGKYYRIGIITMSALLAFCLFSYYAYKMLLPTVIAETITGETSTSLLPKKVVAKIDEYKKPINVTTEDILFEMDSLHIPFELVLKYVDNVKKETIIKTYHEIEAQGTTDRNAIFDIVKKNVTVTEMDPEILRGTFLKYATEPRISRVMNYIKMHHLLDEIDVSLSREVIKKVLIQKKDEINKRLNAHGDQKIIFD
jgi:hypothetical protein